MKNGNEDVLKWLLEDNQPVVRYHALTQLLGRPMNDPDVREAYSQIPKRGWAKDILDKQKPGGYWEALQRKGQKSLYHPKYLATNWRMIVLADFGLTSKNRQFRAGCDLFFKNWLPTEEELLDGAEACISGNLARTLIRGGYYDDPMVKRILTWLLDTQKADGGWHCFPSGTGTLDCWEPLSAFAALPKGKWSRSIKKSVERGAEFYLERRLLNEGKRRYLPWFRFHFPVHYYYDILVGLDVITSLGYGDDKRLKDPLQVMLSKRLENGRWALDALQPDLNRYSMYQQRKRAKPFEIEKPGQPSKWITLVALRVLERVGA